MTTTSEPSNAAQLRALICGVSGQDGAYLTRFLLDKGYTVIGTSRDASAANTTGLRALGVLDRMKIVSMAPNDFRSVLQTVIRVAPDEIYNLSGQTSVGLSFDQPVEAIESITIGTLNILEAIRFASRPIRLYNAGSSECFGDTGNQPANEQTPFHPRSPYAVAKVCSHNLATNYREAYGMFTCTGILFNHESALRPERFVTQKVVRAASRIAEGSIETLRLGNLDIHRDWGWAPDYVEVMWRMLQEDVARDFVIATGRTVSLEYFVANAFSFFGLDWHEHVLQDKTLMRPSDVHYGAADVTLASNLLGWRATRDVDHVINDMCSAAGESKTGISGAHSC
jgi:GDPmannose 4,6-dehydratase